MKRLLYRFKKVRFFGHRYLLLFGFFTLLAMAWSGLGLTYFNFLASQDFVNAAVWKIGFLINLTVALQVLYRTWGRVILNRYVRLLVFVLLNGLSIVVSFHILRYGYWVYQTVPLEGVWFTLKWPLILGLVTTVLLAQLPPLIYYYMTVYFALWRPLRQFTKSRGGDAAFASVATYRDKNVRYVPNSGGRTKAFILGSTTVEHDPFSRLVGDANDVNCLTVGGIGSGKSSTLIYTVLSTFIGAVVCLDPKGEFSKATIQRRSECKGSFSGKTYMLDPFLVNPELPSSFLNPLSEIDKDDPKSVGIVLAIAEACVLDDPDGKNAFFTDSARNLISGAIAFVLCTMPEEQHTLPVVFDKLYGISESGESSTKLFEDFIFEMSLTPGLGGLAQQASKDLTDMGERTRGSVLSTVAISLKWIADPFMRSYLEQPSSFSLKNFGLGSDTPTAYVVLPFGKMESHKRFFRLMMTLGIGYMRDRQEKPRTPCLFLLDEMPQLGQVPSIAAAYSTMRSSGIRLWGFCQNWSQLKTIYGEEAHNFISASTTIFMGVSDTETSTLVSDMLGETTLKNGDTHKLLTPSEVTRILDKGANRQIVFPGKESGGRESMPYLLERLSYVFYSSDFRHHFGHAAYYPKEHLSPDPLAQLYAKVLSLFSSASGSNLGQASDPV